MTSETICNPRGTSVNVATPLPSFNRSVAPSSLKVNWATGERGLPPVSKVSFTTVIHPVGKEELDELSADELELEELDSVDELLLELDEETSLEELLDELEGALLEDEAAFVSSLS